jgi:PAS domain S-box-containing protein
VNSNNLQKLLFFSAILYSVLVLVIFSLMKQMAYNNAFEQIQDTLMNVKAIRHYVSSQQKQEIYRLQDEGLLSHDYFQPQILSSTYTAKSINDYYNYIRKQQQLSGIELRFAATNPRNTANKANSFEQELIEKFNSKELSEYKTIKTNKNGDNVLYYALPSRPLEPKCMKCHSTPDKAPKGLVDIYGDKNGFYEQEGSIRALISTEYTLEHMDKFVYKSTAILSLISLIIFIIFILFYNRFSRKIIQRSEQLKQLNDTLESRVKQETKALRTSNIQLKSVIKGADLGYWDWNLKTDKLDVNQKWLDILGLSEKDITHTKDDWEKRIFPEDLEKVFAVVQEAISQNRAFTVEFRMQHKKGHYVWIEGAGSIIEKQSGKPVRACGTHKEITDRKKDEQKLVQESKLSSMSEMIGNIAHQWRQPLSLISTSASGVKIKKEYGMLQDEELLEACDTIDNTAQHLSQTIDEFSAFIQGDSQKTIFNLKEEIENFKSLIDTAVHKNNIQLELFCEDGIEIESFPNELLQCLINIFNNSKEAFIENQIEESKRFITIECIKKDNTEIEIRFKDSAGGVSDEVLSKIYDPYFTTKHQTQGKGLGLHVTRNLVVELMNGSIHMNNTTVIKGKKHYSGLECIIVLSK